MPQPVPLTQSEQDLIGQVCNFAAQRAENGVYLNMLHSRSLGQPVMFIVALGDQALALQALVMKGAQPPESPLVSIEQNNGQW